MRIMKKVFLFLAFFGAFATANISAQSCCQKGTAATGEKACCGGKACAMKMASAAKADPTIEARLDPNGSTYYVRKESDNAGKVRLVDVKFDEPAGKFVNVAPPTQTNVAPAAGMVKKEAACTTEQKAGCAKEGKAGGCCAGKKAASKE